MSSKFDITVSQSQKDISSQQHMAEDNLNKWDCVLMRENKIKKVEVKYKIDYFNRKVK
jgi:hypothetical protein